MKIALIVVALLWPAVLGAAAIDRADGRISSAGTLVYLAASRICHQQAHRSFLLRGQPWPVCARCSGLYAAAPLGALAAASWARRRSRRWVVAGLVVAAIPTGLSWGAEVVLGIPVTNVGRAVAALPLGAAVAFALVWAVTQQTARIDRID